MDQDPNTQSSEQAAKNRLVTIELDESAFSSPSPDIDHERKVAIFDLLEQNEFTVVDESKTAEGPFHLTLSIADNRLVLDIADHQERQCAVFGLSMSPFRRIVKDYFMICDSYFQAIKSATPSQIEAIDMGRRGLHNDGSEVLQARLAGKIEVDFNTARRLFTLICVLHWRG
ncbi:MAG: UPF0262 family protein [Alphaproteobacteria bacterium]|nr:UPF0262 family protein [Alphaproteobacteria bacterium]